jgi:hypothetical protein
MPMNHYGELALRHWQNARPQELATIEDQERFFTDLGEQVQNEILRRAQELESPMGEDYLANLGMLNEARATAESDVLREMVFTEPETAS